MFKQKYTHGRRRASYPPVVFIPSVKNRSKKIAVGDIAYIEADRDNCILHMVDGDDHRLSCPMCDVLDRFDPRIYVRVHRSFVVNICMVSEICKTMVFMDNGMTIKVGDMYKDSILDKFPIIGFRKREK